MINYWSFNSHVQDVIGGAHLFNGSNASLTSDRYGRPLSALSLNNGYYQMPAVNYFQTEEFTVTSWVYVRGHIQWSRLVEFFNGPSITDSIRFIICDNINLTKFLLNNGTFTIGTVNSTVILNNKWYHIGVTFGNKNLSLYYNATLISSVLTTQKFKNITRKYNFIGRSNSFTTTSDPHFNGIVDDFKIFNKALNQKEIQFEMNNQI